MSIKADYDSKGMWNKAWPEELRLYQKKAVDLWEKSHEDEILTTKLIQFFAFTQWNALHEYAKSKNVEIIGDIPIFVSADSADVWANQKYFQLKENGESRVAALVGSPSSSVTLHRTFLSVRPFIVATLVVSVTELPPRIRAGASRISTSVARVEDTNRS